MTVRCIHGSIPGKCHFCDLAGAILGELKGTGDQEPNGLFAAKDSVWWGEPQAKSGIVYGAGLLEAGTDGYRMIEESLTFYPCTGFNSNYIRAEIRNFHGEVIIASDWISRSGLIKGMYVPALVWEIDL